MSKKQSSGRDLGLLLVQNFMKENKRSDEDGLFGNEGHWQVECNSREKGPFMQNFDFKVDDEKARGG